MEKSFSNFESSNKPNIQTELPANPKKRTSCYPSFSFFGARGSSFLFTLTVALQILVSIFTAACTEWKSGGRTFAVVIIFVLFGTELIVVLLSSTYASLNFASVTLSQIWCLFIMKVVVFGALYDFLYLALGQDIDSSTGKLVSNAFFLPDYYKDLSRSEQILSFLYMSISFQTLVGEGNMAPKHCIAQLLSSFQYLLGVFYSTVATAVVLQRWDTAGYKMKPKLLSRWWRFKHNIVIKTIRYFLREYLGPITIFLQISKFFFLNYLETDAFNEKVAYKEYVLVGLIVWDCVQISAILVVSLKIVRLGHDYHTVTLWLLIKSYLSTIVSFGGVYVDIYYTDKTSFTLKEATSFWKTVANFEFFALSTMTGTGVTGSLVPRNAVTYIVCMIQISASLLYHMFIFGMGLVAISQRIFERNHDIRCETCVEEGNWATSTLEEALLKDQKQDCTWNQMPEETHSIDNQAPGTGSDTSPKSQCTHLGSNDMNYQCNSYPHKPSFLGNIFVAHRLRAMSASSQPQRPLFRDVQRFENQSQLAVPGRLIKSKRSVRLKQGGHSLPQHGSSLSILEEVCRSVSFSTPSRGEYTQV